MASSRFSGHYLKLELKLEATLYKPRGEGYTSIVEKKTVYLETSVVSYLANHPSRDLIVAGHQAATRDWWEIKRTNYDLYVSELVIAEASRGREEAAQKRLALLDGIALLAWKAATSHL